MCPIWTFTAYCKELTPDLTSPLHTWTLQKRTPYTVHSEWEIQSWGLGEWEDGGKLCPILHKQQQQLLLRRSNQHLFANRTFAPLFSTLCVSATIHTAVGSPIALYFSSNISLIHGAELVKNSHRNMFCPSCKRGRYDGRRNLGEQDILAKLKMEASSQSNADSVILLH